MRNLFHFLKNLFYRLFEPFLYWPTLEAKFKVTGRIVDRFNKCIWENSNNIVFMAGIKMLQMPGCIQNKLLMYPLFLPLTGKRFLIIFPTLVISWKCSFYKAVQDTDIFFTGFFFLLICLFFFAFPFFFWYQVAFSFSG